jgi:hypothetical protein
MQPISFPVFGPFGWPNYENGQPALLNIPGVYLMTVNFQEGYLPFWVGITRRPVRKRFLEHTRAYLNGDYNIIEIESAQQGIRKVLWKGWGWTPEKRADYTARQAEITSFAKHLMMESSIFIIDMGITPRLLERMEAAIANLYYQQSDPLFDRGMFLMPRWENEEPIISSIQTGCKLYGLPTNIEI